MQLHFAENLPLYAERHLRLAPTADLGRFEPDLLVGSHQRWVTLEDGLTLVGRLPTDDQVLSADCVARLAAGGRTIWSVEVRSRGPCQFVRRLHFAILREGREAWLWSLGTDELPVFLNKRALPHARPEDIGDQGRGAIPLVLPTGRIDLHRLDLCVIELRRDEAAVASAPTGPSGAARASVGVDSLAARGPAEPSLARFRAGAAQRRLVDLVPHRSARMRELLEGLDQQRVATSPLPVLILGETGTGKEHLARAIHLAGGGKVLARKDAFVPVLTPNFEPTIIAAALFGSRRGAFTGAEDREGFVEAAAGGTLFLDELGELPLEVQCRLNRLLEGKFTRLGDNHEQDCDDVRVVAATNRDLAAMVRAGTFREDLWHRFPHKIQLPPLRERPEDIDAIAADILSQQVARLGWRCELTPEAWGRIRAHPWPGNVRDLRNVLVKACHCAAGPRLGAGDLDLPQQEAAAPPGRPSGTDAAGAPASPPPATVPAPSAATPAGARRTLDQSAAALVLEALRRAGYQKRQALAELKVSARRLDHWIRNAVILAAAAGDHEAIAELAAARERDKRCLPNLGELIHAASDSALNQWVAGALVSLAKQTTALDAALGPCPAGRRRSTLEALIAAGLRADARAEAVLGAGPPARGAAASRADEG